MTIEDYIAFLERAPILRGLGASGNNWTEALCVRRNVHGYLRRMGKCQHGVWFLGDRYCDRVNSPGSFAMFAATAFGHLRISQIDRLRPTR
jgi:hypothetical protein